nr:PREDICTED: putative homeodomain transcription factor isoform X2 [Bemisia tabaci]
MERYFNARCSYQKKIGTYDKQEWEKTVEQRILSGFTHVPKKSAKLKTDLIDVDLVRGSAFTKAKPKHGILTVSRLAVLRLLCLPLHSKWWIAQTSSYVFALLLFLYVLQLVNIIIYYYASSLYENEQVSFYEVLLPVAMMLVLSLIHSQIVSTHSLNKKQDGGQSSLLNRRSKRTKRRLCPPSRSRLNICSDSKSSPDTGSELAGGLSDSAKYTKRTRSRNSITEDSQTVLVRRSVVWDTSPVKTKPQVIIHHDVDVVEGEDLSRCPPESRLGKDERKQLAGIDRMNVPDGNEADPEVPPDDDGFESLNGNGSSDNNDEDQKSEENMCLEPSASSPSHLSVVKNCYHRENSPDCDSVDQIKPVIRNNFKSAKLTDEILEVSVCEPACTPLKVKNAAKDKSTDSHFNSLQDPSFTQEVPYDISKKWNVTLRRRLSSPLTSVNGEKETDSEGSDGEFSTAAPTSRSQHSLSRRRGSQQLQVTLKPLAESSYNSSGEESENEGFCPLTEGTTSAGECLGITTNSECSYSSDNNYEHFDNDSPFAWELEQSPTVILSPSCAASDKVSCTMWEKREIKKADLSVLDISSAIIARVEAMPEHLDYFYGGLVISVVLAAVPSLCRLMESLNDTLAAPQITVELSSLDTQSFLESAYSFLSAAVVSLINSAFGTTVWERIVILIAFIQRAVLSALFFFLLAVAERTFKQRFLYAKFFSHLTSFRRAHKSELPHFRLNKVRNIKTWLSVRSYLKKRGPQRSVDVIVSSAFIICLLLLSFLSVELLKDSVRLHSEYNVEALVWCLVLGFFLLRFMTLGTKINRKYRNLSVLITEQINLYLQIEQKPNKKEELMVANSVLKLAADLLKELESPFKISGLSANPYLYTITKVVILSALSGVLSEMLGFKLKLHKIKIK